MNEIIGAIMRFTFNVLNMQLPWDDSSFSLIEVMFFRLELLVLMMFIFRILMFFARKYDL